MRRFNKIQVIVVASLALTSVGAGSLVIAADGVTIADRMGDLSAMLVASADAPTQSITAGCATPTPLTLPLPTLACDLWARADVINIPGLGSPAGDPVPVWGFSTAETGPATLPGPTIVAESGQTVSITVHNTLPVAAGDLSLDLRGVPVSARASTYPLHGIDSDTYTFIADQVGTSIYSAGASTPNGIRQVAMGLSGVLIVRPAECAVATFSGCAYGDPAAAGNAGSTATGGYNVGTDAFNDEALVALNDIDLEFAAAPLTFDMTMYHPTAHLINGKVFPETDVIDTQIGHNVLLRYANLGLVDHTMALVGKHQRIIGRDASALPHGSDDIAISLNVGQTVDAMVAVPLDALSGYRYSLSDQARQPGSQNANGALTFMTVFGPIAATEGRPSGDIWDIQTSTAPVLPAVDPILGAPGSGLETSGYTDLYFTGSINSSPAFGRFSIDDPGKLLNSTVLPGDVTITGNAFSGIIPVAELSTLANGNHSLWVQFSTDGLDWGNPAGIAFTVDRAGPVVQPVEADVSYTNGTTDVAVGATADATLTGTGEVVDGTATLDACPPIASQPIGVDLTPNGAGPLGEGPVVELTGVIPAAAFTSLPDGVHVINVSAVDNRGRWSNDGAVGATQLAKCGTGTVILDRTAPLTSAASVSPNPNDGTMAFPGIESYLDVVRISAIVNDPTPTLAASPAGVSEVEGFIDDGLLALPLSPANNGTGFRFTATDGLFDEAQEEVYADIPLAAVASMTPGSHDIWVHGMDNAGNWELLTATASTTLTVLSGAPLVTTFTFEPTTGDLGVTAAASGTEVTITALEYAVGSSPVAPGTGILVPVTVADQGAVVSTVLGPIAIAPDGNVWVRAQDSTGKWGPAVGLPTSSTPLITSAGSGPNNLRRRLSGTATATAGTVVTVEYSIGASAAAAGTGSVIANVNAGGLYIVTRSQANKFTVGSVVWVRVLDSQGNWGPAASVTVVGP